MKALRLSLALAIIAGMAASLLYVIDITSLNKSPPDYISEKDLLALNELQKGFQKCVRVNGLGLLAEPKDHCRVSMKFPIDTVPKWSDPKTGQIEGLSYDFNLCESLSLWELVRNSSTILTREYIDALPNGWRDYAWTRINKGIALNKCENRTLCKEKLSLVLPQTPPFAPRQFGHCAIVGNSGDLLKTRFGEEIDRYDAVVRNNGAPVQNYTRYVGKKSTFRLLNRGSAKALDKVAALDETGEEALIIKTTIHDIMNKMIREVPILNPVYLMLGMSLGPSAKGTGLKALEFALSICETVDIYGFTVDPGYTEWTRYFSESRGGHTPLQGRAYYQMMECLGLIKIHSPMREERGHIVQDVPDRLVIDAARMASDRVLGKVTFGKGDPLGACVMWAERAKEKKRQQLKTGVKQDPPVSQYPLQHSDSNGMLCIKPRIFRDKS